MAALLERVLERVRQGGARPGLNVVAYSGGVDSSVVAACVHRVFGLENRAVAALGVSASLPRRQLAQAREVAREDIGIPLVEVRTTEGSRPAYVANEGESCYHCKVSLYGDVIADISRHFQHDGHVQLFNGTNADDLADPTRLGLIAAREFGVQSPLDELTKDEVRQVAAALQLRTARIAASPCLRSRLAPGVRALEEHLAMVERAEDVVRAELCLGVSENLRFRMLRGGRYRVEVDAPYLEAAQAVLGHLEEALEVPTSALEVGAFRSGSVSKTVAIPSFARESAPTVRTRKRS